MAKRCVASWAVWVAVAGVARAEVVRLPPTVGSDVRVGGEVVVAGEVRVVGATLTIEAGSRVGFEASGGSEGIIVLDGRPGSPARLVLAGEAGREIEVVGSGQEGAGRITVARPHVAEDDSLGIAAPAYGSVVARHVRFSGLGRVRPVPAARTQPAGDAGGSRPGAADDAAVAVVLGPGDRLELRQCVFEACGPVVASFHHDEATALLEGVRLAAGAGHVALALHGSGRGRKQVRRCRIYGCVEIWTDDVEFRGNVVTGTGPLLTAQGATAGGVEIAGNYIHNTTTADDGGYGVSVSAKASRLTDNVIIWGTWAVRRAPGEVRGNVFVGAPHLESEVLTTAAMTHQLVAEFPDKAVVRNNVFFGPAYALLATSEGTRQIDIVENVFDGRGQTPCAIRLNLLADEAIRARVERNLFIGLGRHVIWDEAGRKDAEVRTGGNVLVAPPASAYEAAVTAAGEGDRQAEVGAAIGLADVPEPPIESWEREVLAGRLEPGDVMGWWRRWYCPNVADLPRWGLPGSCREPESRAGEEQSRRDEARRNP